MLSNDEIITYFNSIFRDKESEKEKIRRLSDYYKSIEASVKLNRDKKTSLTRNQLNVNDWTYIFSKTYPNCCYYNLPEVKAWMIDEVYQNLDEISKIVLRQLVIF